MYADPSLVETGGKKFIRNFQSKNFSLITNINFFTAHLAAVLRVGVEVPLVLRITGGGVLWGGDHLLGTRKLYSAKTGQRNFTQQKTGQRNFIQLKQN